jgi:glycogen debranching enzyme
MNRNEPPLQVLYGGGTALVCAGNGQIHSEELHGLFAADTRVLSTYRFTIAGHEWQLLSRSRQGSRVNWDFQNPAIRSPSGDIEEGSLHLRVRRDVDGALHDCLNLSVFGMRRLHVRLTLQIDADFSDVFQVKDRRTPPRLKTMRTLTATGLHLSYNRNGFSRGLEVGIDSRSGRLTFVGTQIVFDLELQAGEAWSSCVDASPIVDGKVCTFRGDPHHTAPEGRDGDRELSEAAPSIDTNPLLATPFVCGRSDLRRLVMADDSGSRFVAAGAPWFMALFGRDTLVTSLMSGLLGPWILDGVLEALRPLQAHKRDDFRDADPGKLPHELRRGELAWSRDIPHTPYYGCHDAPALHVLSLWNAFRWTGDRELLARNLPVAVRALQWCLGDGDPDGDGFLEYDTRSRLGYRNQGWKDSGDAIVHEDGRLAETPLATVELQGYLYAALLAMAA